MKPRRSASTPARWCAVECWNWFPICSIYSKTREFLIDFGRKATFHELIRGSLGSGRVGEAAKSTFRVREAVYRRRPACPRHPLTVPIMDEFSNQR